MNFDVGVGVDVEECAVVTASVEDAQAAADACPVEAVGVMCQEYPVGPLLFLSDFYLFY